RSSANKSFLFQATPSILTHDRLIAFLKDKVLTLGTAACPPYHLAIVIGGTSAELTMKTVKLASCRYLDDLPTRGSEDGHAFRDLEMEQEVHRLTQSLGVGAQFGGEVVHIDLRPPMKENLAQLSKYPIKTRLSLTGPMIVARDLAHSKLRERLERGEGLPDYFKNHPVYYAGPAKTPQGYASGAFGPTTAGRMDAFVHDFQAAGGSMIMLAKGNRSSAVREACKKHGGFYLASIGGAAANVAEHCIKKVETVEYPELGMEAVWKIDVENFPAFIVIDDKGNDFFQELNLG